MIGSGTDSASEHSGERAGAQRDPLSIDDAIKKLRSLSNLRDAREACERGIHALEKEKASGAGLIHHVASPLAGTEPRPICANPEDCCRELTRVWAALGVKHYNGKSASENVVALRCIADQLVIEAKMATNALGCVAKAQYQHAEVARLHIAIDLLNEQLIGCAPVTVGEASATLPSEAK